MAKIIAVCKSKEKGTKKEAVAEGILEGRLWAYR